MGKSLKCLVLTSRAGFACPKVKLFCHRNEFRLVVTGQRIQPGRVVLAGRVMEPDHWLRRCGCEVPLVTSEAVVQRLDHEPLGRRPTMLEVPRAPLPLQSLRARVNSVGPDPCHLSAAGNACRCLNRSGAHEGSL